LTAILGISAFYHDSAAALVVDGEIVAAAQEERFSRKKHDERFPTAAAAYCLQAAGLAPDRLDYIAFYEKPLAKFERLLETYLAHAPLGVGSFSLAMPLWLRDKLYTRRAIRRGLPGGREDAHRLSRPSREPRRQRFFPMPLRPRGHPHPRRRRRMEYRQLWSRRGQPSPFDASSQVSALARLALFRLNLLLRFQGQTAANTN